KIIIDLEDEVVSLLEKEKANLKRIESLKSKGFESSENAISKTENQSENDCQVVEKECDKVENPKVIAPGMFKLSVSQSVLPISMSKTFCDSKNVENLDTFGSVRRPKHSGVIWKKKGSSNISNVDLSSVSSAYVCNDAMNVSCNSRICDLFNENNLFIFNDESVRISPVSKMPFRKKLCVSMNVRSESNSNKSLPRTVHKWLPKIQPLAEPVAKWIPKVKHCPDLSLDHRFGMFKAYDRTPQQNGVVERRNRTLVEAARTMLTFANLSLFLWAEAIATACFTQNRSIIHKRFDKTPYELMNKRKPNIKFFHVYGCRCYLLNDYEDVGKIKAKGDIGVFVG
nr:retrovirus-related Pol polyprotein from transposon TNT 1-94 [Tanacetum cinerariifolium]